MNQLCSQLTGLSNPLLHLQKLSSFLLPPNDLGFVHTALEERPMWTKVVLDQWVSLTLGFTSFPLRTEMSQSADGWIVIIHPTCGKDFTHL